MSHLQSLPDLHPQSIRVETPNGLGLNVWDHGGEGPRLVLSHCTGTHGRIWDPLVPALREHFQVYAWDTRGHGDSDKPADPDQYTWRYSGEDVLAVYDQLGFESDVRAIGHSAGASHLCYAELMRPGVVSKALLIDPIIHPPITGNWENPLAIAAAKRRRHFDSKQAAYDNYASKKPMNAWTPETLSAYVEHGFSGLPDCRIELKCLPEIESAVYARGGSNDIFDRLNEIGFGVILVTSRNSNVHQMAELQKSHYRNPTYIELDGPSHFIPQEVPTEIIELALSHLP